MGCGIGVEGAKYMGKRDKSAAIPPPKCNRDGTRRVSGKDESDSRGESRLQYHLRNVTGTVQGASAEKMNQIAGVESVDIHMDNNLVRFVARCVGDPAKFSDMLPVGFGDAGRGVINDELAEKGEGRRWVDHGPQRVNTEGQKDGFVSTLTRAVSILPEGKPLWGGQCRKVEVEVVDPYLVDDPKDPDAWEKEISKAGIGGACVFSDGSLLENGPCGGWTICRRNRWTGKRS